MLAMVYGVPLVFGIFVWNSYRARRAAGERSYAPEGKLRWEEPR